MGVPPGLFGEEQAASFGDHPPNMVTPYRFPCAGRCRPANHPKFGEALDRDVDAQGLPVNPQFLQELFAMR